MQTPPAGLGGGLRDTGWCVGHGSEGHASAVHTSPAVLSLHCAALASPDPLGPAGESVGPGGCFPSAFPLVRKDSGRGVSLWKPRVELLGEL